MAWFEAVESVRDDKVDKLLHGMKWVYYWLLSVPCDSICVSKCKSYYGSILFTLKIVKAL